MNEIANILRNQNRMRILGKQCLFLYFYTHSLRATLTRIECLLIVYSRLNRPVDLCYSVASCPSQRPLLLGLGLYALLLHQVLKHIPYNGCIIN